MPITQSHRAVVVLYDVTGSIFHGHCHETDPGVEPLSKEALEKEALEHARRHTKNDDALSKASLLHIDPETFRMDRRYRVDVTLNKLIEV